MTCFFHRLRYISLIVLLAVVAGCGGEQPASEPLRPQFSSIFRNVIKPNCAIPGCHVGTMPESQLNMENADFTYQQLVGKPSTFMPDWQLVQPGDAGRSYIIQKLTGGTIVGERMPSGKPPLPDTVIVIIREWIDSGALQN